MLYPYYSVMKLVSDKFPLRSYIYLFHYLAMSNGMFSFSFSFSFSVLKGKETDVIRHRTDVVGGRKAKKVSFFVD